MGVALEVIRIEFDRFPQIANRLHVLPGQFFDATTPDQSLGAVERTVSQFQPEFDGFLRSPQRVLLIDPGVVQDMHGIRRGERIDGADDCRLESRGRFDRVRVRNAKGDEPFKVGQVPILE